MRAGLLKDYCSLQQQGTVQDELGQPIPGWPEVAKLWANIKFQSGVEVIRADAPTGVAKVSIQIRRRSDVKTGMRLVDAVGTIYRIDNVLPDKEHRDRINLPCEVVGG
jgi:SPP1 family predicted phage head-tail adaptor